jgi:hypothetical protein
MPAKEACFIHGGDVTHHDRFRERFSPSLLLKSRHSLLLIAIPGLGSQHSLVLVAIPGPGSQHSLLG